MSDDYGALREALETVTRRLGLNHPQQTGAVWSRWSDVVGPVIAGHAQPSSLRRGVLRVRCDSPLWATEVGYLSAEIRDRINSMLGMELVTQVRVWTGSDPATKSRLPAPRPRSRVTPGRTSERVRSRDPNEALKYAKAAWARRMRARGQASKRRG